MSSPETLLEEDRISRLYTICKYAYPIPGEFWECGVYKGGSASIMAQVIREDKIKRTLRLFDTFEGLPDIDHEHDLIIDEIFKGKYKADIEDVKTSLPDDFIVFNKGLIPDTFVGLEDTRIALAHIDLDLYQSTKDAIKFIWPRIMPHGMIIFDDYNSYSWPGVTKAVDEVFYDSIVELGPVQAMVIKGYYDGATT